MSPFRVAIGLVLILGIVGYSAFSVITTGQVLGIDARLFLVVAPVLAAAGLPSTSAGGHWPAADADQTKSSLIGSVPLPLKVFLGGGAQIADS